MSKSAARLNHSRRLEIYRLKLVDRALVDRSVWPGSASVNPRQAMLRLVWPKWSHKAPGGPGRTDGCCLKGSKLVVLEVVTRTAGRSMYSYNRSALVPPEAPILPLFGLTLPVRCAAYFGFWTAKPTVSQQDQQHLFRDQIGVLDGNAILFGGVLHNLIFWNR